MKRCINSKKEIIQFGETHFIDFHSIYPDKAFCRSYCTTLPNGDPVSCFPFARQTEAGDIQHIQIERGFWNEKIHIRLNGVYLSYFMYDWSMAMSTYKVSSFNGYGRLSNISKTYTVCSPWFDAENDKSSLQNSLQEMAGWYEEHIDEIQLSYQKQQAWLGKEWRVVKVAKNYLDKKFPTLTEEEVSEMYQAVDRLAEKFKALHIPLDAKLISSFGYFCYGKLPHKFNQWSDEISTMMLSQKGWMAADDLEYTHLFVGTALLYLFHDSQMQVSQTSLKEQNL